MGILLAEKLYGSSYSSYLISEIQLSYLDTATLIMPIPITGELQKFFKWKISEFESNVPQSLTKE